jgi:putative tricarboxylic transport membrane protein
VENLIHGLTALGSVSAIGYLFAGAILGMIVGVIPGLSTVVILSILLIIVQNIDVTGTLCLFLGAQTGSFYSASVSAILLNTPAHPEAFPITFDGYPMARKGQPGRALGLSACSTCIGGLIGCAILVAFLPILDKLPTFFHPPDFLALVTLAMLLVGTLGTDSIVKALVAAGAGLMMASVGPSAITGTFRYTFGAVGLYGGVSLVAVALGVFAIPQMVMIYGTGTASARQDMTGKDIDVSETVEIKDGYTRTLLGGAKETFRYWGTLLQGGVVGGLSGIVPGIGGFTGNFMAYGIAKQVSRRRKLFGTGIPEGIIAPEGSSLAKEAGHIVPIVGLGIPGGVAGALFIGALAIKGMKVGYGFQSAYPSVTGQMVWILALSGIIGTVAGVAVGPQLARVMRVPGPLIVPFILALSVSGAYITDGQFFAVMELLVFAFIGLAMRRLGYPLGGLILGLVLGPTFEDNIYLTHSVYPGLSWVVHRPLADVIFLLCIGLLVAKTFELRGESRRRKAASAERLATIEDPILRLESARDDELFRAPYPLLALVVRVLFLAAAAFFLVYGFTHYDFATGIMPEVGAFTVGIPCLLVLPRDVRNYVRYRRQHDPSGLPPAVAGGLSQIPGGGVLGLARVARPDGAGAMSGTATMAPAGISTQAGAASSEPEPDAEAASGPGRAPIHDRSFGRNGQYRRELIAMGCLLALVGACWLIGFTAGTVLFVAVYGAFLTARNLRTVRGRLIFAGVSAVVMGLVTVELFRLSDVVPYISQIRL